MSLVELVEQVHRLLDRLGLPHAFGGALALGYHASPRGTSDVDVNVFVPFGRASEVVEAFAALDLAAERPAEAWMPLAGVRLTGPEALVVDLFFSVDDIYDDMVGRCLEVPFDRDDLLIPILSAEDLVAFKLSFGRSKDWVDLEQLAALGPRLDLRLIERTLLALRGPTMNPRLARFSAMVRSAG